MLQLFLATALGERTQTDETYWEMWTNWHKSGQRWLPDILTADEHESRFNIFMDNVDKITNHNAEGHSWTMGVTPFADMTAEEFGSRVVGDVCKDHFKANAKLNAAKEKLRQGRRLEVSNPSSIDWVSQGKVSKVKNQGQCGSCWAFSTTGAIEARHAIAKSETFPGATLLSEQELVDCDENDSGCNGGSMQNGFLYAQEHSGLCSEDAYSYTATDGTCTESSCTHYDPVSSYKTVSTGESNLETAVAAGPVSIAIQANQNAFQLYTGGVFDGDCGTQLDHGVLAVGYDNDASEPYWKVKNSWGDDWGEEGYIRMCKDCDKNGSSGQCGIAMDASYPTF